MSDAIDDPYAVLGVARDATDEELRRAYEQRLAAAAGAGALRTAQRVDAAFTVLRDPYRRAVFDHEGRIVDSRRLVPEQRWAPPRAVPFRAWSPTEGTASRATRSSGRGWVTALVIVLVATGVGVALKSGVLPQAAGHSLLGDVWQPPAAAAAEPPVQHVVHRSRLLPSVTAPREPGTFALLGENRDRARWDPCLPVRYVISGNEPFPGGTALLTSAIDEVSAATGLQFVYAGTSTEVPSDNRNPYQPGVYGKRWAPVLVAWTDASTLPRLAGRVVGIGGGTAMTLDGRSRLVSGIVALDGPELGRLAQRTGGSVRVRAVMLHELGHLVGLAHVDDPGEIMNSSAAPLPHYAAGDRRGLAFLGAGPCPYAY